MKEVVISDLGKIVTGNTPPRSKPEFYGSFTPFIKATDISESEKYTYQPEECYSEIGYRKYIKSLIPKDSTCVVTIGSIGKKLTMAHCDCFINQAMNAIIPNDRYDAEYVYYLLKYSLPNLKALDSGTASGRENVSKKAFSNMAVSVEEDKAKQAKIGKILSAYDSLIENNQKQIKLLEEAAQRLYKEWFVDMHFPGYEKVKVVDGVPVGWSKEKVGDLGIVVTGKTPSTSNKDYYGGNIPFITIPDMYTGIYPTSSQSLTESGADSQKKKFIPQNALMVSCIGTAGLVCISKELCQTNQQINSLILKDTNALYYIYFTFVLLRDYLNNIGSNGATMTNVNKSKFEDIEVLLPSKEYLYFFHHKIEKSFKRILILESQFRLLIKSRDLLLPRLMSGEIQVNP